VSHSTGYLTDGTDRNPAAGLALTDPTSARALYRGTPICSTAGRRRPCRSFEATGCGPSTRKADSGAVGC
jgi:hypothetical protein